jgi:hypothetical protein
LELARAASLYVNPARNPEFQANYEREDMQMRKFLQLLAISRHNKILLAGKFPEVVKWGHLKKGKAF